MYGGLGGQNISVSNTTLNSSPESEAFDVSHEIFIFGPFSVFFTPRGVGGQDILAVKVLLAAPDQDEQFALSSSFVALSTVEL